MADGATKNAALTTALAFHYQVLIGIDKCFSLSGEQSVWFEKDGDVSVVDPDPSDSSQVEVKDYSSPLTDHHENLWKSIKNWLAIEFNHAQYGSLILSTTQAFGARTKLKDWNNMDADKRFKTLQDIWLSRSENERKAENPSGIIKFQKEVMEGNSEESIKEILSKLVLHVEADDLDELRNTFCSKLDGFIPKANQQTFVEGLIGFVYEKSSSNSWVIEKQTFDQHRESLTAKWGPRQFTIPNFAQRDASEEEVEAHITEIFAQKILEIKYSEVLPEAIGNWLELRNSLIEELNGYPQFRETVNKYRQQWISTYSAKYRSAKRKTGDAIAISQDLYDLVIGESPFGVEGYPNPDLVFRNGLIQDVMDDEDHDLHWRVDK